MEVTISRSGLNVPAARRDFEFFHSGLSPFQGRGTRPICSSTHPEHGTTRPKLLIVRYLRLSDNVCGILRPLGSLPVSKC
jgi:hypothetical protein